MPKHDSLGIANIYVDMAHQAEHTLTIMSLVKYVYIAHGWTLGYTGESLIKEDVEAWQHGPVVPRVYRAFRKQGVIITKKARSGLMMIVNVEDDLTPVESDIVQGVYKNYSHLQSFELSGLTHGKSTPWAKCDGKFYSTISTADIKEYYEKAVEQEQQGARAKA